MKKILAFSPGHITGFFQICDESENPLERGSRGAGVSVSNGVTTTVEVSSAKRTKIRIGINGDPNVSAPVSESIITRFLDHKPKQHFDIRVNHEVELPIGSGFGTSGAGALSLALALNEVFELGFSKVETAQYAHIVEVEHRTGLGTVIAEFFGGIEIRSAAGGPGFGKVEILPASDEYKVVCLPFGPIPTPIHLNNPTSRRRINEQGGLLTDALRGSPTVANFLEYSRHFAEHIGIITDRVRAVLKDADDRGFTCSTAIFGENIFSLVLPDDVQELVTIFQSHQIPKNEVLVMDIDCKGARVLNA